MKKETTWNSTKQMRNETRANLGRYSSIYIYIFYLIHTLSLCFILLLLGTVFRLVYFILQIISNYERRNSKKGVQRRITFEISEYQNGSRKIKHHSGSYKLLCLVDLTYKVKGEWNTYIFIHLSKKLNETTLYSIY